MSKKNKNELIGYFGEFSEMYLYKDLFLIPYYFAKELGLKMTFYTTEDMSGGKLPDEYRGVAIKYKKRSKVRSYHRVWDLFRYTLMHSRKMEALFLVNLNFIQSVVILLLRLINRDFRLILMLDLEPELARVAEETNFWCHDNLLGKFKKWVLSNSLKNSIICIANESAYDTLNRLFKRWGDYHVCHYYPCVDDEMLHKYGMKIRDEESVPQEHIFLYVGRIGNHQKNTDMLLSALEQVDLKDWKFYLIGPITESFRTDSVSGYQEHIDRFFLDNPEKKGHVIFTGPIYDNRTLFEYYQKSKVFVLSSRHEGFGNVLSEAAAFGCFIVSTDVGGAHLVSNNWKYGIKVEQENSRELAVALQNIVDGKVVMNNDDRFPIERLLYSSLTRKALGK